MSPLRDQGHGSVATLNARSTSGTAPTAAVIARRWRTNPGSSPSGARTRTKSVSSPPKDARTFSRKLHPSESRTKRRSVELSNDTRVKARTARQARTRAANTKDRGRATMRRASACTAAWAFVMARPRKASTRCRFAGAIAPMRQALRTGDSRGSTVRCSQWAPRMRTSRRQLFSACSWAFCCSAHDQVRSGRLRR